LIILHGTIQLKKDYKIMAETQNNKHALYTLVSVFFSGALLQQVMEFLFRFVKPILV
jgi:hypothetical protein